MKVRTYTELIRFNTFEDRYHYLELKGIVGEVTFGFDRWVNQRFYRSREWKQIRDQVIIRDSGCDLGVPGFEIYRGLIIHHMNPITPNQLLEFSDEILDPNFLITVSHNTHNAIHYGDVSLLPREPVVRRPGDTTLW